MSVLPTSILLGGPVIQSSPGGGSSPTPLSESQAAPAPATTGNQEGSPQGGFTEPTSSSPPVAAATSSAAALASDSEGGGGGGGGTDAGVIAGVAVGAAVGAAILTFLITFLLLRKKNKKSRRHREHRSGSGGLSTYTEKALPKDPSPGADAVVAAAAWQRHLPQSADDKTIRSSVKTLFDQVEVHVENFYRDAAVRMTEDLQAELLHVDSPHLPESVVALLQRVRSQTALIKHCLLSYIVASITTDDDSVPSLLPADYAALPHLARATGEKKPGKHYLLFPLSATGSVAS